MIISSIGVHKRRDGTGYRITYPTRKVGEQNQTIFHPTEPSFSKEIEQAICNKAEEMFGDHSITYCLLHMSQNGIPFQGPLICDGELHRFSRDGKGNPDEWLIAYSGLLNSGQPYTYCIYGSWSDGSKFEYKSWEEFSNKVCYSAIDRKELQRRPKSRDLQSEGIQLTTTRSNIYQFENQIVREIYALIDFGKNCLFLHVAVPNLSLRM